MKEKLDGSYLWLPIPMAAIPPSTSAAKCTASPSAETPARGGSQPLPSDLTAWPAGARRPGV